MLAYETDSGNWFRLYENVFVVTPVIACSPVKRLSETEIWLCPWTSSLITDSKLVFKLPDTLRGSNL